MHNQLLKAGMPKKAEGFSDVMVRTIFIQMHLDACTVRVSYLPAVLPVSVLPACMPAMSAHAERVSSPILAPKLRAIFHAVLVSGEFQPVDASASHL